MGWVVLAAAIAMLACMQGWNGATDRKEDGTAKVMTILFFLFLAILLGSIVKVTFF